MRARTCAWAAGSIAGAIAGARYGLAAIPRRWVNALDAGGLQAMKTSLAGAYQSFAGQNERISAVLTGHAHIDLVWLWPERSSEYKAVHTFSTMDRLMDIYPEFVFGYSQPASYEAVERISPKLMKRVTRRIKSGRWEPVGATEQKNTALSFPRFAQEFKACAAEGR